VHADVDFNYRIWTFFVAQNNIKWLVSLKFSTLRMTPRWLQQLTPLMSHKNRNCKLID